MRYTCGLRWTAAACGRRRRLLPACTTARVHSPRATRSACAALRCAVSCGLATEAQCHGGRRPGFHLPVGELERVFVLVVPEQPAHPKHLIPLTRARAARSYAVPDPTSMHAAACGCILYIVYLCCKTRVCVAVRCTNVTCAHPSDIPAEVLCAALRYCSAALDIPALSALRYCEYSAVLLPVRHWTFRLKPNAASSARAKRSTANT